MKTTSASSISRREFLGASTAGAVAGASLVPKAIRPEADTTQSTGRSPVKQPNLVIFFPDQ
ncbi:MAG: twin-arginine translocation signal domain-containing protein [Luteitalea sp.]|nr:twin-arginine translocation signal domain-containing protein [Luteitalea sp.]